MYSFWRTRKAIALISIAFFRFWKLIFLEFINILNLLNIYKKKEKEDSVANFTIEKKKPIIFVSVCKNKNNMGGQKYNGGIKELNYLIKLLRLKGYEAYFVTYDGSYDKWLMDHQPHISIKDFRNKINKNSNFRCVTSWIEAKSFIDLSPKFYFWDMELGATNNVHFSKLNKYIRSKRIKNVAGISRTVQAWYLSHFNRSCTIIPNLIDQTNWYEKPEIRIRNRVGYMNEGKHTEKFIKEISSISNKHELNLEYFEIYGDEKQVLEMMRTCNIYLSLNIGKEKLFGEGCPRTIIESMAAGCINISFDIIGNKEIVINNYNGFIAEKKTPNSMATLLVDIYIKNNFEYYRNNSLELLNKVHNLNNRWNAVKSFLQL